MLKPNQSFRSANGKVPELGTKLEEGDQLEVNGQIVGRLNKPKKINLGK